jgi:hypothetical protein
MFPHRGVASVAIKQHPAAHPDDAPAAGFVQVQIPGLEHALQDRHHGR